MMWLTHGFPPEMGFRRRRPDAIDAVKKILSIQNCRRIGRHVYCWRVTRDHRRFMHLGESHPRHRLENEAAADAPRRA